MSLGAWLVAILAGGLALWLLADFLVWIFGEETATRWIIARHNRQPSLKPLLLAMIVLVASLLIVHLELL